MSQVPLQKSTTNGTTTKLDQRKSATVRKISLFPSKPIFLMSHCLGKNDYSFRTPWLIFCGQIDYFWPLLVLLEPKHHTATPHFGTVGWTEHWVKVPKCAVAVWCLASKSLHGGPKWSLLNEISFHISNSRTKPAKIKQTPNLSYFKPNYVFFGHTMIA